MEVVIFSCLCPFGESWSLKISLETRDLRLVAGLGISSWYFDQKQVDLRVPTSPTPEQLWTFEPVLRMRDSGLWRKSMTKRWRKKNKDIIFLMSSSRHVRKLLGISWIYLVMPTAIPVSSSVTSWTRITIKDYLSFIDQWALVSTAMKRPRFWGFSYPALVVNLFKTSYGRMQRSYWGTRRDWRLHTTRVLFCYWKFGSLLGFGMLLSCHSLSPTYCPACSLPITSTTRLSVFSQLLRSSNTLLYYRHL